MIYLDAAATSFLKPDCVRRAVYDAMGSIGSPGRGAHEVTLAAARQVFACRMQIAELFDCEDASRVVFTSGITESLNLAVYGLLSPKDHVITTAMEHNSVLRPLYRLREQGMALTILPADADGHVDWTQAEAHLRHNTRAVVCTHASNVTGAVQDIDQIGAFCQAHGLLFVLDTAQTAGAIAISMQRTPLSVVCFTGHKGLLGPQGTGGMCIAPQVSLHSCKVGGSGIHSFSESHPTALPEALEAGTLNAHGIAGLSAALSYLQQQGIEEIYRKECACARAFYERVQEIPAVRVYGDGAWHSRMAIVALNIGDADAGMVSDALQERYGICTRAGAHCAPLMHQALGTKEQGIVRFSFSHLNSMQEVAQAAAAVRTLAAELG